MTNNINEIVGALGGKSTGDNSWLCHCPAHQDKTPSLSVSLVDGKILCRCHAGCSQEAVLSALRDRGLWAEKKTETTAKVKKQRTLVDTYNYLDTEGKTLYQVCRFDPKDFRQRAPDGKGGWKWSLKGIKRVLYHLPEVLAAEKVFICEGEKDADAICALGWIATTNAGGASNWIPEYSASLNGKECIILPDNDGPGMEHAQKIARSLNGIAKSVKIVELPDLPQKGDVSNWIGNGNTMDSLLEIVDKTEESGLRIVPDFTGITEEQGQELLMGVSGDARWGAAAHLCKMYSEKGYSDSEVITLLKKWNVRNLPPFSDVEIEDIVKSEYEKDQQKKFSGIAEAIKRILILKYPDGTTKYKLYMEDDKTTTINVEELLSSRKTCAKIVEATRVVFNPQKQDKWLDLVRVWLNTAKEEEVAIEETDLGIVKEIIGEWTDQWNKHKKSEHINQTSMLTNSCVVMDSKIYFILAHLEEDLRFKGVKLTRTVLCEQLRSLGAKVTKPRKRFDKVRIRTWEIRENNNTE